MADAANSGFAHARPGHPRFGFWLAYRSQERDGTKHNFGYIPKAEIRQEAGNQGHAKTRRNAMTRAPILSAAAAALLLSLAAMGPLAAEDAATPAAPAMTPAPSASPAPAKGEFDTSCAMGLADGQMVKTD